MELDKFVQGLRESYGTNLKSVILYGSAVTGDSAKNNNDIMVILADISPGELARGAKFIQQWMGAGNPEPLITDENHIKTSLDVFPIEFSDIRARHKILLGDNPLKDLPIKRGNLRLQCEREIKGLILALRERYVALYPNKRRISQLMLDSSGAFFAIFRATLRLLGKEVPSAKEAMLQKFNEATQIDTGTFNRILLTKTGEQKIEQEEALPLFSNYITTLEKVANLIDGL